MTKTKNKKLFFLLPIIPACLLPVCSVISCSKNNEDTNQSNEYINDLKYLIQNGQVNIKLDLTNNDKKDNNISILLFDDEYKKYNLYLQLDESKININDQSKKQERINEINKKINETKISYSRFLFPKLGEDGLTKIFFNLEIGSVKSEVGIAFQTLAKDNNYKIKNLGVAELKKLIEDKILSIRNIISDLSYMIDKFLLENIEQQVNNNEIIIDNVLQDNINRFILGKCNYFEEEINYCHLIPSIIQINQNKELFLTISLWTSEINDSNKNDVSKLDIPFNFKKQ